MVFSQVQNVPTTQHGCSSQFCNFTPPKTWSKIWSNSTPSSIYDAVSFSLPCCNVAILLLQKQLKMHLFRGDFFPFFFQETNCKSCYAWIKDAKETHKRRKKIMVRNHFHFRVTDNIDFQCLDANLGWRNFFIQFVTSWGKIGEMQSQYRLSRMTGKMWHPGNPKHKLLNQVNGSRENSFKGSNHSLKNAWPR